MYPSNSDFEKMNDRTSHGVRIDKQREVSLREAAENFEKKRAAFLRKKRAADEEDNSLFVRSDDDLNALSSSDPLPVHDRKKLKPTPRRNDDTNDCTCAISHFCERARRLDVRECRSLAPAPRKTVAKVKESAPK